MSGYANRRALYALIIIKDKLLENNELSLEVSETGSAVSARHIDTVVSSYMSMESELIELRAKWLAEKDENAMWREIMGGYTVDMLSADEAAELRALVAKWEAKDDEKA